MHTPDDQTLVPLSTRVPRSVLEKLKAEAAARGVSHGEYARELLVNATSLSGEMREMRTFIAKAVGVLLLNVTDENEKEIAAWIEANLGVRIT